MAHKQLTEAKTKPKYEFYTLLPDIEKELKNYKSFFKNKTVLCNCDDPYESNFFKYFALNFNNLKLKKLICTCYDESAVSGDQLSLFEENIKIKDKKTAYKTIITEVKDYNGDGNIDLKDVEYMLKHMNVVEVLEGNGDFSSDECIELLKEADVIVTNPPFNLFRKLIKLLVDNNKDFILIGNTNALSYKEIFQLFQMDKIRTGATNFNTGMYFIVPDNYTKFKKIDQGKKMARVSNSCWFTSLPVKKHTEELVLTSRYKGNEDKYPKYYNFDAIDVGIYTDIPEDYYGLMGVPVTFLDKYCPSQFELIGLGISSSGLSIGVKPYEDEHKNYRKNVEHKGVVNGDLYFVDNNNHPVVPYARVIIRRKDYENNA